jgi:hypothetical protein
MILFTAILSNILVSTTLAVASHTYVFHLLDDERFSKISLLEHKPSTTSSKSLTGSQVGPIASGQLADDIVALTFLLYFFVLNLTFTEIPLLRRKHFFCVTVYRFCGAVGWVCSNGSPAKCSIVQ